MYEANGSSRYEIHGLLAISVKGADTPLRRVLHAELSHFERPGPVADLLVVLGEHLEPGPRRSIALGDGLYADPEGAELIVRAHGGTPGHPSRVLYEIRGDMRRDDHVTVHVPSPRPEHSTWTKACRAILKGTLSRRAESEANEILARVLEPFLYYRLPAKGHVLVHAAGVAAGSAVLLSGASNVGKTLLTLRLLNHGLAFLGDDLVVLRADGTVLPYPKRVNLERHDLAAYPGLVEKLSARMPWFERRLFRRHLARRGGVFPSLERLWVQDLLPGARVSGAVPLRAVFHLRRGPDDDVVLRETDPGASAARTAANLFWEFNHQRWRHGNYHHAMSFARDEDPLAHESAHHARVSALFASALSGARAYELLLPPLLEEHDIERAVDEIARIASDPLRT